MPIKGIVTRPLPDWFYRYGASGSGLAATDFVNTYYVGLYNNATDGSELWVYGLSAWCQTTNPTIATYAAYQPADTFVANGLPVVLGGASVFGQIHTGMDNNWALETPGWSFTKQGNGKAIIFAPYPLAIIRPGWQWNVLEQAASNGLAVSFYWIALPGTAVSSG